MRKRPRRKRPKRSSRGGAQLDQKLSKTVRELYRPGSSDDGGEWQAGLEAELAAPRRRPAGSRPEGAQGAGEADAEQAAGAERSGTVLSIFSGACRLESEGQELDCVLSSELAREQQAALAVGDEVIFSVLADGGGRLSRVLARRTTLSRPDPRNPRRERVIAANVDVAVHVASVVKPALRPALIDRYLIAIGKGGAEALVCVNKIDLLADAADRRRELDRLAPYRELGLEILPCSAATGEGIELLRRRLAGQTAVFVGHSGVGKSSLLNALSPGLDAATGRVKRRSGTGQHTTSRSHLYRIGGDTRVIDTPGIREFGLWQLGAEELRAGFPDFEPHAARCRFADCSHSHEPECAVRSAVSARLVSRARYATYRRLLESLEDAETSATPRKPS